jgi:hypothetical protein
MNSPIPPCGEMRINEGEEFGVERDTDIVDDGVRREGGDGGGSEERVE